MSAGREPSLGYPDVNQEWLHRAVAVTGATGFLGSHLVDMLVQRGADVVVLVRDVVPATDITTRWRGRVAEVRGDVRDQHLLERLFGEYGVSCVFHLAAQTQVEVANANPVSTFQSNIEGTWALLEAARRSPNVRGIVAASSDKAYGAQPILPYTEETPLQAVHPYDVSKACADLICASYARVFDVPVVVTRCGNFFGPGDTNWARLIPSVSRDLLEGRQPVIRSDGTPVRDYLYIREAALAYIRLGEAILADAGLAGEAFNFSSGHPLTVLDMVDMISKAVGVAGVPDVKATARHEIAAQHLDSSKARTVLGWEPAYSTEEALAETVAWYREHLGIQP